ncbi:MAG: FHA domain-containing protein [Lachnospiraceae bacterium]|nr:FHA domain-containing protein [Lachnospiraceae bacterium]
MTAVLLFWSLFLLLKKYVRYRKRKKEIEFVTSEHMRDENLNNIIMNAHAKEKHNREGCKPYDVDYGGREKENVSNIFMKVHHGQMIQLVEKNELSVRKFVFSLDSPIQIGSDLQNNDISLPVKELAPHQCKIFIDNGKIYVVNLDAKNRTTLCRGKAKITVGNRGIRMLSGDRILIENISYDVTFMT